MTAGLLLHATIHPIPLPLLVQVVYASARRLPFAGVDITRYVADLLASRTCKWKANRKRACGLLQGLVQFKSTSTTVIIMRMSTHLRSGRQVESVQARFLELEKGATPLHWYAFRSGSNAPQSNLPVAQAQQSSMLIN
eukprot:1139307-Pelagomonas_calceolata.AAC.1